MKEHNRMLMDNFREGQMKLHFVDLACSAYDRVPRKELVEKRVIRV